MYTQSEVINKLNSLVQYSCDMDAENASIYQSLMSPLISEVTKYFTADRSEFKIPLNTLQLSFYNDIIKRQTKYSKDVDFNMGTNYPLGYDDIRNLFYTFPCMDVSNETFHQAWVEELDEATALPIITHNTLIDIWTLSLSTAKQDELANINALNDWLEKASSDAGMVMLWEDLGVVEQQPNTKEIANIVFEYKHLKECIEKLNLPMYKPTYK